MAEIIDTSVGAFEISWGADQYGALWIEIDPDGGRADNPNIEAVAAEVDVGAALTRAGIPPSEATSLARGLWERRWRGTAQRHELQ